MKKGKVLVIDDDEDILLTTRVVLKKHLDKFTAVNSPKQLKELLTNRKYDVALVDMNFSVGAISGEEGIDTLQKIRKYSPQTKVIMMTAYGDIDLAVEAMKKGATDFIVKPWDNKKLLHTVLSAVKQYHNEQVLPANNLSPTSENDSSVIIGQSPAIQHVFEAIEKVAATDANVLILGENGTGKELVARAIHQQSTRSSAVFVSVDMGSIAPTLFESEMFGHTKGAFTDAKENREGRIKAASGGTLFLDEIGNIPVEMQIKLLSALQNRTIQPVGSTHSYPIDIRLICATNKAIHDMVRQNQFRQDLLYRINTVEVQLPPLRERVSDIPLLAGHFLSVYKNKYDKTNLEISQSALNKLKKYHFPGNIRELRHAIERAVIMSDSETLQAGDFIFNQKDEKKIEFNDLNMNEIERDVIQTALQKHQGNITKAAKELGFGRTTLYRKMAKYGL